MNIKTFKTIAPLLLKHNIVPFLHGAQGIGKTETVEQVSKELGIGFVALHLATQDVGDLVGLLVKDANGNVKHSRPAWMPTEGEGVIFLDEFNRATPDVLQCMFSFLTEKTIHSHKLPNGWKIVAAGNYDSNKFNVTNTKDAALRSRFCHIDFVPTAEEFIVYAESKNTRGSNVVASFVRDNPTTIEGKSSKDGLSFLNSMEPDRRALLGKIAKLEDEDLGDARYEIYAGCIGTPTAAAFMAHRNKAEKSVSIMEVLTKFDDKLAAKIKDTVNKDGDRRYDLLNQPIDELMTRLENNPNLLTGANALDNLKKFLLLVPLELASKAFKRMSKLNFYGKDEILNNKDFVFKMAKK